MNLREREGAWTRSFGSNSKRPITGLPETRPAAQRDTPENTFAAFTAYITNRTFDYDFEHLPITPPHTDLV